MLELLEAAPAITESLAVIWPIVVVALVAHWRVVRPWMREVKQTAAWRTRMEVAVASIDGVASRLAEHERECTTRNERVERENRIRYERIVADIADIKVAIARGQAGNTLVR